MTYETEQAAVEGAGADQTVVLAYERPQLVLVGNMNDLLAGTGTKETDDHIDCNGGPLAPC
jgi:hypothetical protein